jgi:hypothetical protein
LEGAGGGKNKIANLKNNFLKFQYEALSPFGGGRGREKKL